MVIGVCGYGYTGSGALLDLFREYKNFSQCPFDDVEIMLTYYPDGLESLAYNLYEAPSRFMSSDIAIYRFERFMYQYARSSKVVKAATHGKIPEITEEFLKNITDIEWSGSWLFDFYQKQETNIGWFMSRAFRTIQRILEKKGMYIPLNQRNMRLAVDEDRFYKEARAYIGKIIDVMYPDKHSRVILNQPFAANFPTKSFVFFDDPRAIIVDRDPRDVYILSKRAVKSRSEWIPTDDVNKFIKYYRWMHSHFDKEIQNENVVIVNYEDLIFNSELVIEDIEKIIGELGEKNGERHFFPEVSINNTQLFKKYPEYITDISVIERELPEYLYDFSDKQTPKFDTETF